MPDYKTWSHPYPINPKYNTRTAYFSMEFGIHQPLKIYSGGLGYLAGSHMRSAYELQQNLIGIGILWKYGYYDQRRSNDRSMLAMFSQKHYTFLEDTGIKVPVYINQHQVLVKALYLPPHVFETAPIYLLTTDLQENDHLAQTITNNLYDSNVETRVVQNMILGIGGAKVVDILGGADVYHMNEGHSLPLTFHLYSKYGDLQAVKEKVVFTTHTPVKAGNEVHDIQLLNKMGFFADVPISKARELTGVEDDDFGYTPAALRMSKIANGVSKLHGVTANKMWEGLEGICPIIAITNAQNEKYWADKQLYKSLEEADNSALFERKREMKKELFEVVANDCGKLFDPEVLTIVWARRFAGYKRADLIMRDMMQYLEFIENQDTPIQIIWAGKPFPKDYNAISLFDHIAQFNYKKKNAAVLTGYEMTLSKLLKKGADIWLNTPRRPMEASGTSGMTASMNGAINFSVNDGWIPEFAKHGENAFILPEADSSQPISQQDNFDHKNLVNILKNDIIPTYYKDKDNWGKIMRNSMNDVLPYFGSNRMADQYYSELYDFQG